MDSKLVIIDNIIKLNFNDLNYNKIIEIEKEHSIIKEYNK